MQYIFLFALLTKVTDESLCLQLLCISNKIISLIGIMWNSHTVSKKFKEKTFLENFNITAIENIQQNLPTCEWFQNRFLHL